MSADTTTIDESEWSDGVYYDGETGDYVTFEFTEDSIREVHVFSDAEIYVFSRDEFAEERDGFRQISEDVVSDPADVVDDVMIAASENPMAAHTGYNAIEIRYARLTTVVSNAETDE